MCKYFVTENVKAKPTGKLMVLTSEEEFRFELNTARMLDEKVKFVSLPVSKLGIECKETFDKFCQKFPYNVSDKVKFVWRDGEV